MESAPTPVPRLASLAEAERRQLTVVFCDVVDSTKLAAQLDPEDWREMLRAYYESVASVVERFDGHVAQYLGDGVVIYFGCPTAHEDDAERAVRAGLGIVEAIGERRSETKKRYGRDLAVRVGIHTGMVVVGDVGTGVRHEMQAVGDTTNVAARIQTAAEAGTVLISAATLRLAHGAFVAADRGACRLKGIDDPIQLHRVIRPSGVRSPFDIVSAEGLTPFVGREQEVKILLQCWAQAKHGRGQVVLLGGEPGIGKSRLVRALHERLADEPCTWLECRASWFHSNTAFHPVTRLMEDGLGLSAGDPAETKLSRLEQALGAVKLTPSEVVPLFASLLELPLSERYAPPPISPEARRRRTLEALARWLLGLAESKPTVLVVEDLHWIDPSSLDLLGMLIERVSRASVLLLPTFRTTFEPRWALGSHVTRVTLGALTRRETEAMVERITKGKRLPAAVLDQVVKRTDGVPLFVEELTKTILESGLLTESGDRFERTGLLPELSVPATIQDSLMARLDRLGPAKEVAQLASLLGRDFSYELLAAVSNADARSLGHGLARLVTAGILQQQGESTSASYTFRHVLIQQTAYHSLLKATRREWQARVAHVIEERLPSRAASEPERLAWHCEEGGLIEKAISYYQRAGERATRRSANAETISHLKKGIALLLTLEGDAERDGRELILQVELGTTLVATNGWGSVEAESAYGRARELCERMGEPPQLFRVMRGLITFYTARAELETARDLACRLLDLAERAGEASLLLLAHEQLAILCYFLGTPSAALEHFERAIALYEPADHRRLTYIYGEHLGVFTRIWMAWALWLLGYADRAVERCREAIDLGREASHPFSLAYALLWSSILHVMRTEPGRGRELAEQAVAISEEHGFAFVLGGGRLVQAWANPETGAAAEEFRRCLSQIAATGTQVNGPMMLGYLADAHRKAGQADEGIASADAALAVSARTRQTHWDAELHRIKGELLLQQGQAAEGEAERLFRLACEIARSQNAKSLELRAAVSLGRLWQKQGRGAETRTLVAPIYAWFTEGFDTPDLVEARALLEDRAASVGGPDE
jgi:class 3 adenylate cyclase/predicted ATPase